VLGGPDIRGYGSLFIANGLAEFAHATGEEKWLDEAKSILTQFMEYYDGPYPVTGIDVEGPPRVLGVWMVLLRIATQILEHREDEFLEELTGRCIEAVVKYHYHPGYRLLNEHLNHDMSRPDSDAAQFVTGHSYETAWMLMFEARRRNDENLQYAAADLFHRHIEVFWDDVYDGIWHWLEHVDKNIIGQDMTKTLWAQEELLLGSLHAYELTGADWALEWFERAFIHMRETLIVPDSPVWLHRVDRKYQEETLHQVEHYHHIRHLSHNLLSLNRIIEQQGNA
jgi:mannose/cellobiose epimerase-like protein (N-acyl-D-glucosamine 2-epimerase family)